MLWSLRLITETDFQIKSAGTYVPRRLCFVSFAVVHVISGATCTVQGWVIFPRYQKAYHRATKGLSMVTRLLQQAVGANTPTIVRRYQVGLCPPAILIHAEQVRYVPAFYRRVSHCDLAPSVVVDQLKNVFPIQAWTPAISALFFTRSPLIQSRSPDHYHGFNMCVRG